MSWIIIIQLIIGCFLVFGFFWYGYLDKGEDVSGRYPPADKDLRALQTEQIVNKYGEVLANNPGTFKPKSALPYSKDKIKSAILRYISLVIDKKGHIPDDLEKSLVSGYSSIEVFVDDEEAERLNKIENKIRSDDSSEVSEDETSEYFDNVQSRLFNTENRQEIKEHIQESIKNKR